MLEREAIPEGAAGYDVIGLPFSFDRPPSAGCRRSILARAVEAAARLPLRRLPEAESTSEQIRKRERFAPSMDTTARNEEACDLRDVDDRRAVRLCASLFADTVLSSLANTPPRSRRSARLEGCGKGQRVGKI
ncbi:hypothetical protein KM043_000944 [Ampulex compressa]|nr:hypothetical protein KM043_000944 [Ampulex compressa]